MASLYLSLTESQVERIKPPGDGEMFYRDAGLAGFGLKVTSSGIKSYFVEARVKGKGRTRRKVLGRHPTLPFDTARSQAMVYLSHFGQGQDPVGDEREIQGDEHNPTLQRVRDDYFKAKGLKPATEADYKKVLKWGAEDWLTVPITEIDRDMIARRHQELGKRSKAQANYLMRVIRALFNYAIEAYRGPRGRLIITDNPVLLLSRVGAWHRVRRRRTVIAANDLPAWFKAVDALEGERLGERAEAARDYLKFLLYTGARKTEGARLHRSNIDLQAKTFTLVETKNWNDHALPMSEPVWEILARRMDAGGEWAFPGRDGPISDCRYWIAKVREASKVQFTLHDLRRTFTTVAEGLDLSGYTLKRLLNHKINESDVTSGYIVSDVERLREPMRRISERIVELSAPDADSTGERP